MNLEKNLSTIHKIVLILDFMKKIDLSKNLVSEISEIELSITDLYNDLQDANVMISTLEHELEIEIVMLSDAYRAIDFMLKLNKDIFETFSFMKDYDSFYKRYKSILEYLDIKEEEI